MQTQDIAPTGCCDRFSKAGVYTSFLLPLILVFSAFLDSLFRSLSGFIIFGVLHVVFFILLLLFTLAFFLIACGFMIACLINLARTRWRRAMSLGLLPAIAVSIVIWALPLVVRIEWAAAFAHYSMFRPFYAAQVDSTPFGTEPRLIWFFWRDASALSDLTLEYLLYDESDEVSLPANKRSATFNDRAMETYRTANGMVFGPKIENVGHIVGHYYAVYTH